MKKIIILSFLMCCITIPMLHAHTAETPFSQFENQQNQQSEYFDYLNNTPTQNYKPFSSPLLRAAGDGCPFCGVGTLDASGACDNCSYVADGNTGTGTEPDSSPISDAIPFMIVIALVYGVMVYRKRYRVKNAD